MRRTIRWTLDPVMFDSDTYNVTVEIEGTKEDFDWKIVEVQKNFEPYNGAIEKNLFDRVCDQVNIEDSNIRKQLDDN